MKYIFLVVVILIFCFAGGGTIMAWFKYRKKKKEKKVPGRPFMILGTLMTSCLLMIIVAFGYLQIYYHAEPEVERYLKSGSTVSVDYTKKGYFFDGPGKDSLLIFYQGAKVEAISYAPMLYHLAEQGVDAFLVESPFRMAIFGSGALDWIMEKYEHGHKYLCGHSFGGMIACGYVNEYVDSLDGVIVLAAYPMAEMEDGLAFYSVYGSRDGCLEHQAYEESKSLWPKKRYEEVIGGGNHAQFGNYGIQVGDGEAMVSPDRQQQIAIDVILRCVKETSENR